MDEQREMERKKAGFPNACTPYAHYERARADKEFKDECVYVCFLTAGATRRAEVLDFFLLKNSYISGTFYVGPCLTAFHQIVLLAFTPDYAGCTPAIWARLKNTHQYQSNKGAAGISSHIFIANLAIISNKHPPLLKLESIHL